MSELPRLNLCCTIFKYKVRSWSQRVRIERSSICKPLSLLVQLMESLWSTLQDNPNRPCLLSSLKLDFDFIDISSCYLSLCSLHTFHIQLKAGIGWSYLVWYTFHHKLYKSEENVSRTKPWAPLRAFIYRHSFPVFRQHPPSGRKESVVKLLHTCFPSQTCC